MLITLLERQLVCLKILKMQEREERYLLHEKVSFSAPKKCLTIWALASHHSELYSTSVLFLVLV